MKISYNWLKTYLPENYHRPVEDMADLLTDIGLEVEGAKAIETVKGGLKGLVIGEVKTKTKHPDADRLSLTTVDVGNGEPLPIVCGAPNVEAGQKVVVATVGSILYPSEGEPFKIKKSKIRGAVSMGMICAEDEIGLGESHDGIMVLNADAKTGQEAAEYFNIESDYEIEIGLTPNRADAMSHWGVARDIVAAINIREGKSEKLKQPEIPELKKERDLPIKVSVEDAKKAPRYAGLVIDGLEVKDSPDWLQNRLRSIGLSPINNVVDVTNFILHDMGQPLHAFDYEGIDGQYVIVKTLPQNTSFTTLDETERKLDENDLMICHENGGMCMAGVFGGVQSGVTEKTTRIFLESAYFNPVSVRKTAKRHALNTDASYRFERGIDPNITIDALKKATALIIEVAGGKVASETYDLYPQPFQSFDVTFNPERCRMLAGGFISDEEMEKILSELDVAITQNGDEWNLKVPCYRNDVLREADIVEEVLRLYGFNRIAIPEKVSLSIARQRDPEPVIYQEKVSDFLSAQGFREAMSNSLTSRESLQNIDGKTDNHVKILNPLSADLDTLRTNLLISGLDNIAWNLNRQQKNIHLYEFGKTYGKGGSGYYENSRLGIWITGAEHANDWQNPDKEADFYTLKKTVLALLKHFGIQQGLKWSESNDKNWAYGLTGKFRKKQLVTLGEIQPGVLKKWDIDQPLFYAELDWNTLITAISTSTVKFTELPKFQSVRRDLSMLLDDTVSYTDLEKTARQQDQKILRDTGLFDVYMGKNLPQGKKSYAMQFTFRDDNKTLTDEQVDKVMQKIIAAFQKDFNAELR